jgi:hypothetical protein
MSVRAIIGIISISAVVVGSFLTNILLFMIIEGIDRQRHDGSLFSEFGFARLRPLQVLREYRSSYPDGKLHIYGAAAFAAAMIGIVGLAGVGVYTMIVNEPLVRITSPADGAIFTAPANIVISANLSAGDNTLSRVDFYQGTTLVGSSTTPPYSVTWSNVPVGNYSLTAKATDYRGTETTSNPVTITVNTPGKTDP